MRVLGVTDKMLDVLWARREAVAEVVAETVRDDTGVHYAVSVTMRDVQCYEEGDDRLSVWQHRVEFGCTDATCAGGGAFVRAAREQERVAAEVWSFCKGVRS